VGYNPEHYKNNKDAYAAKSRAWRERNKERCKENRRRHYVENKEANLAYSAEYSLKRKFNITKEQYDTMLHEQGGVCAICKGVCTRALAVDHCHTTGKVRGLLCNNCNRGIGHLKDSVEILEAAINYLRRT
jgi:hypothetical protein